jgi:hypothetical protein
MAVNISLLFKNSNMEELFRSIYNEQAIKASELISPKPGPQRFYHFQTIEQD